MKRRFPFVASFVCLCAFFVLIGLGVWQVQRLAWKTELQHKIDVLMSRHDLPELSSDDFDFENPNDLKRGLVFARFDLSKAIYLNGYLDRGKTLYPVLVPARLESSEMNFAALLWVDQKKRSKDWAGKRSLDWGMYGILRQPEPSVFKPDNNPDNEEWWQIDVQQLAGFWELDRLAPAVFYAENPPMIDENLGVYNFPTQLKNDHLQYAIFWFTMAGVLCVLWGVRFLRPYLQSA
ncbi:MAG: SURF1 family protein [Alphaproteobacteria bacterium]|nr:SURF1 family protein [Alphaproteobacteria bacterium]